MAQCKPMIEDATQQEKREVLRNDQRVRETSTYHSVAQASIDDERGGRYASESKQTVIGSSPISYPTMPEGNPWRCDPVPDEPLIDGRGEGDRLGYAIDRPDAPSTAASVESVEGGGLNDPPRSATPFKRRI